MAPCDVAWLDGRYLPLAEARISPLDRGFLFGDAVYEAIPVYDGKVYRLEEDLDRLERSLSVSWATLLIGILPWALFAVMRLPGASGFMVFFTAMARPSLLRGSTVRG